ncbi:hypothetical protein C0991_012317 [Blastosporella zonata]|nr:hypothetical protein C0991_012317 [Blastosporella zonata]
MDFPSIVSSTSDLAFYPPVQHDSSEFEMTDNLNSAALPTSSNQDRHPLRGLSHLAIITAFILPFTIVPYVLARRQISALRLQLAETHTSVKILEQEMNLSWQEMTSRKDDVQKLRGSLWKVLQEREQERTLSEKKDLESSGFQREVKTELQNLLKESQNARSHGATLRSLGTSLADVAAFMHEIELEMGMPYTRSKDKRDIDRLRSLAQQMQNPEESSGTAVAPMTDPPQLLQTSDDSHEIAPSTGLGAPGHEQALESHEVIELQTFSERKVWIEEKIRFLEKLPPIQVFAGLDAVRTSAEHVPGVPTSDELKKWIAEHDAIEKETEIFDRGELTKLRQLTKAATQRNLSPADTDVIELTLTTIYELDKLLHLLRDRSENLELLAIRLTWEESRITSWIDRRTILDDLRTFLETRVRWTPSVYEKSAMWGDETPGPTRRGSIASFASANSDASTTSSGFSRGARFKLAELLSHDAAQFAGRVTSLRHGKITAAGKILDKLIDHSRKPVPEELLDEQDKLEEQGIADMENLGKFVLNMVMQWRKADETYVETMKDKTTAQNLFEEIETAKLHHPSARQSASFVSRADALIKRLSFRGNPVSSASAFPYPEHPLFNDQKNANQMLAQFLSSEISTTFATARKVDNAAKAYRAALEAVNRVEDLTVTAKELLETFTAVLGQLQDGIPSEGDGSPPDLSSIACLEPDRHSAFITIFPSLCQQLARTSESSNQVLRQSVPAMLDLDHPGIDGEFANNACSVFGSLELVQKQVQAACEDTKARCDHLHQARWLRATVDGTSKSLEALRSRLLTAINTQRWRRVTAPRSPTEALLASSSEGMTRVELAKELAHIDSQMSQGVDAPLRSVLDGPIKLWFLQQSSMLKGLVEGITKQANLLDSIQRQAAAMTAVHEEFNNLQLGIDGAKDQFDARTQEVLSDQLVNGSIREVDVDLHANLDTMQSEVARFVRSLSDRVLFVSHNSSSPSFNLASNDSSSGTKQLSPFDLEFDLPAIDTAVRADSNSFAMTLSKQVDDLSRHLSHFRLARIAKEVDAMLLVTSAAINQLFKDLRAAKSALSEIVSRTEDITLPLSTLLQDSEKALQHANAAEVKRSFSQIRDFLQNIDTSSEANDPFARETLYVSRHKAADDVAALHRSWENDVSAFFEEIRQKQSVEIERLELLKIVEEQQAERDRAALEEAEYLRLEQETLERELLENLEKERIAEALRQQAEDERLAAEEARLEQARLEAEERRRSEDHRLAEERRVQIEKDRIAAERAKEDRLMRECMAADAEKARVEHERIEAEARRVQIEKDRIAAERAEENRLMRERMAADAEMVRMERERVETEARGVQIEKDRIAAERAEEDRLMRERMAVDGEKARVERERVQMEKSRIAAERAEKDRLTRERVAADAEKARVEHEHVEVEARRVQIENVRVTAERAEEDRLTRERMAADAEKVRVEHERLGAEESRSLEAEQIAEEKRMQDKKDLEAESAVVVERQRLERDERRRLEDERSAKDTGAQMVMDSAEEEQIQTARLERGLTDTHQTCDLAAPDERQPSGNEGPSEKSDIEDAVGAESRRLEKERSMVTVEHDDKTLGRQHLDNGMLAETGSPTAAHVMEQHRGQLVSEEGMPLPGQFSSDVAPYQMQDVQVQVKAVDADHLIRRMKPEQPQTREGRRPMQSPEMQRKHKTDRSATTSSSASQPKTRPLVEEGERFQCFLHNSCDNKMKDIFGLQVTPAAGSSKTKEIRDLQAQILAFRRRLRTMNINDIARPKKSSTQLPDLNQSKKMAREFSNISSGVSLLPRSAADSTVDVELRSLRTEIEGSAELIKRVETLAYLREDIQKCDTALSDLLEHIDSYPASPKDLSSPHTPLLETTPEEQLTARLTFARGTIESVTSRFSAVSTDSRAIVEKVRIIQTWSELEDMGQDRLGGRRSRPASAISSLHSSGRNSSASIINPRATTSKKAGAYANLSVSSGAAHQRLLLPRYPTSRRVVSGGTAESQSRSISRLSTLSSNRAVSGPLDMSVYGSTFASRQRTSSLSNSQSIPVKVPSVAPVRSRAETVQHSRVASPTGSEASSYSRRTPTRSSTSMSTWSRAPRHSLSSIAPGIRSPTPKKRSVVPRKTYIADPRNKLDVAVGDVVNQLPVGIKIEGVSETWKDQSGKYWIGNQDPKLCFCRILRSQTVMVRVGGGWSELSKFIKDHFADSFRILPESPPRFGGAPEEKWISSTTLLDASIEVEPPCPPRTPEPTMPFVPSFSLSTPNGKSPRSLHSASNSPSTKGSPLTPLQFIRRADHVDNILRPGTPSRPSTNPRPRGAMTQNHTPARHSIWRP